MTPIEHFLLYFCILLNLVFIFYVVRLCKHLGRISKALDEISDVILPSGLGGK